ncbi:hypothetical protein NKH77_12160 [Streptomyces sp. M19]
MLAFADLDSPLRAPFTLFFLIVAPASAVGSTLRGLDPLSRPVLAVAGAVVLDLLVAQAMLALHLWSARGGVLAVGGLSLLILLPAQACERAVRVGDTARNAMREPGLRRGHRHIPAR